ncbi:membrane protein insertase YidC [Candidatus Peregrinibacteria bacterium]|nr:MAG: membrane protein insertase YidC [Candidatus Peregrinibacteria bacterium]
MSTLPKKSPDRLFRFALTFFLVWLGLTLLIPKTEQKTGDVGAVSITSKKETYPTGQLVTFEIKNPTEKEIDVRVDLEKREDGEWKSLPTPQEDFVLQAGEKKPVSFSQENIKLFGSAGKFRASLEATNGDFLAENEFTVEEAGFFRSLLRAIFYRPIYNALIIFLDLTGKHLWISIILLTLLIKFALLVPSKKGILAQQKMQKIQPEIDELRKKYEKDPQKQAQEMMELWKRHKINPGAALWPVLLQFPVLIALFFVIQNGFLPHAAFLIYPLPFLSDFTFSGVNYQFLWLHLNEPDPYYILPVIIGALQFFQMFLMKSRNKKQKVTQGKSEEPSQQEMIMNMMTYILPGVVVIFSIGLPSAVGLYWGISTIFALAQQEMLRKTGNTEKKHEQKSKKYPSDSEKSKRIRA